MLKKTMLLAVMAVAAAALAVPAMASAAIWTHEGKELEGTAHITASGTLKLETTGIAGSVECHVDATAILSNTPETPHNEATFNITTATCVTGGVLAPCTVTGTPSQPAMLEPTGVDGVEVTGVSFTDELTGCSFEPGVTATGNLQPEVVTGTEGITALTFNQNTGTLATSTGLPAHVYGTLTVEEGANTYGVE